jgi:hypothetical protein
VNFCGFQTKLNTKEDFLFCQHYERETLSDFFWRFLRLNAQASEVSDKQVITQAIKALCACQLHSHLVRDHPKTLEELYDNFQKFSSAEVLHFRKLDQLKEGSQGEQKLKTHQIQQKQRECDEL